MTAKALMADLLELSTEQRMQLVEELWDSIASSPEQVPVTEAQKRELDRRLDAYRADPAAGSSWEKVKESILRRKP